MAVAGKYMPHCLVLTSATLTSLQHTQSLVSSVHTMVETCFHNHCFVSTTQSSLSNVHNTKNPLCHIAQRNATVDATWGCHSYHWLTGHWQMATQSIALCGWNLNGQKTEHAVRVESPVQTVTPLLYLHKCHQTWQPQMTLLVAWPCLCCSCFSSIWLKICSSFLHTVRKSFYDFSPPHHLFILCSLGSPSHCSHCITWYYPFISLLDTK